MNIRSFLVLVIIVIAACTFPAIPFLAGESGGSPALSGYMVLKQPGISGCPVIPAGDCLQNGPLIVVLAAKSPLFRSSADPMTVSQGDTVQTKPMSAPGFKEFTSLMTPLMTRTPITGGSSVPVTTPATIKPLATPGIPKFPVTASGTPLLKTNMFVTGQSSLPKIAFPALNSTLSQPEENKTPDYVSDTTRTIEQRIFYYTNLERTKFGKSPYVYDSKLSDIARNDAVDMATRNFFDHINPDGENPTDRAKRQGYNVEKDYSTYYRIGVGENIAMVQHIQGTPDDIAQFIVNAWMNSPDHRENILDLNGADYTNLGVGVAYDPANDTYLAVQEFF